MNYDFFLFNEKIIPPSFELASESYNQVYTNQTVRVSSRFIGCGGHYLFLKNVQNLMFTYPIYVPFIDVISIMLWLGNLVTFFILKIRRGWCKIVIPSSSLLFEVMGYPIYLRILFLECWSYLVNVSCLWYNIYWLCIWNWGFKSNV